VLPQFIPEPDTVSGFVRQAIAKLVREHQDLPAMMRFVGEHVRKHCRAGGPGPRPTAAREFRDAPLRIAGQSIRQHSQALRCTLLVRRGGLLQRAAVRIERRGTLQMRRRVFDPREAVVVQMRKDRADRAAIPSFAGRLRPPRAPIEMREHKLVHRVVHGIRFYQHITNLGGS